MNYVVKDISRLSALRRNISFPQRVCRAPLQLGGIFVAAMVVVVLVLAIGDVLEGTAPFEWLSLDLDTDNPDKVFWAVMLVLLVILFVPSLHRCSRGGKIASILLILVFAVAFVSELFDIGRGVISEFPRHWINRNLSIFERMTLDLADDVRLIPSRLFGAVIAVVYIAIIWRILKASRLEKNQISKEDKSVIFATSSQLSFIVANLKHWMRRPFVLSAFFQICLASLFFGLYIIFVSLAIMTPFVATTELRGDYNFLRFIEYVAYVSALGWIYVIAVARIGFVLLLSRLWFLISKLFLLLSNRALVMSADRLRAIDTRSPVLYLRSFRNDKLPAIAPGETGFLAAFDPYRETATMEQLILRRCYAIGPLVAIADPKTPIQPFGAARKVAGDKDWRAIVEEYMGEAAMIVVLMDYTENLRWEIERLNLGKHLARALFVFPPTETSAEYESMQAILNDVVFVGRLKPWARLPDGTHACMVSAMPDGANVICSQTATFADYDLGLQIMLKNSYMNGSGPMANFRAAQIGSGSSALL